MVAPSSDLFIGSAKRFFNAKGIRLPVRWQEMGPHYDAAFALEEKQVAPNPVTNLFGEPSRNKYHVGAAGQIGKRLEGYIEGICRAVCHAIEKWMQMATVSGVVINGPTGVVVPGCVQGPPLLPFIMARAPRAGEWELKYTTAIARTFDAHWRAWHTGLSGNLIYPAFAAFPGPMAPPTPNAPVPLAAFASTGEAGLSPAALKAAMHRNLADNSAQHAGDLFDAVAKAFGNMFHMFKISTMVVNVMGSGPVGTFAPPAVPAGPVVCGSVIPCPGVLQ